VYELKQRGTLIPLHSFNMKTNGEYPAGGVIRVKGTFYGTARRGGSSDFGTVWKLAPYVKGARAQ